MTNNVLVENIDKDGFWINVNQKRIYAPFAKFKIFKNVKVNDLFDVSYLPGDILHWENADIDLYVDTFLHPENYVQIFEAYPSRSEKETINACTRNGIKTNTQPSESKCARIAKKLIVLAKELMENTSEE